MNLHPPMIDENFGVGYSARFDLGHADGLWPEICDSLEGCHV